MQTPADEVLAATRRLLDAIAAADWKTYGELVDEDVTCFEPEARGQLVAGMPFHRFYFDVARQAAPAASSSTTTLASPVVRMLGADAAMVAYVRLVQKLDAAGSPVVSCSEETRVWRRSAGGWRQVHFHRSTPG